LIGLIGFTGLGGPIYLGASGVRYGATKPIKFIKHIKQDKPMESDSPEMEV
jgi:hypothetical protein